MRSILNLYRVYRMARLSPRKAIFKAIAAWNKGF
jgi:hypothetical protein